MIQSTKEHITYVMFVSYRGGSKVCKLGLFGGKLAIIVWVFASDDSYIVTHAQWDSLLITVLQMVCLQSN